MKAVYAVEELRQATTRAISPVGVVIQSPEDGRQWETRAEDLPSTVRSAWHSIELVVVWSEGPDDQGGRATALASEAVLKAIWDTPEEDEAWRDL